MTMQFANTINVTRLRVVVCPKILVRLLLFSCVRQCLRMMGHSNLHIQGSCQTRKGNAIADNMYPSSSADRTVSTFWDTNACYLNGKTWNINHLRCFVNLLTDKNQIEPVERLRYLRHCVSGEAKECIEEYPLDVFVIPWGKATFRAAV